MLAALAWTHPVHGVVTERLCPPHELAARQAFAELDIDYTTQLVVGGRCHRCDGRRPWQGQRRPNGPADHAPASPGGEVSTPARAGWFHDGAPSWGASAVAEGGGAPTGAFRPGSSVTGGSRPLVAPKS
jgi:hypothetical protein